MLVISRREYEKFTLVLPDGQTAVVTVVGIRTNTVKVGIEAPPSIRIIRNELIPSAAKEA